MCACERKTARKAVRKKDRGCSFCLNMIIRLWTSLHARPPLQAPRSILSSRRRMQPRGPSFLLTTHRGFFLCPLRIGCIMNERAIKDNLRIESTKISEHHQVPSNCTAWGNRKHRNLDDNISL
jgi:hypothetical protein